LPAADPRGQAYEVLLYVIAAATVLLSIQPVMNLCSRNQIMNTSYNPFHLVNTYGAFGSVTKERYEIVIEGTDDTTLAAGTRWQEYEFKGKPGNPLRRPPQVAPYHLRLDWLVWFLPFSVTVHRNRIWVPGHEMWFIRFMQRLLQNDRATLKLLKHNPFENRRPTYVRALFYHYRYSSPEERRATGAWWVRRLIDVYLAPVSLP
jgi:lipase maturation factor